MSDMPIVDPHHHLWDLEKYYYVWLSGEPLDTIVGDYSSITHTYLVGDYLRDMGSQNVIKSVHIQCEFDPSNPAGESEWLQAAADEHGFPHGIVGAAHLEDADVEQLLASHARFPNFRGIRQMLNWHEDPVLSFTSRSDYMTDSDWRRGFGLLEKYDLSFDLQLYPAQMPDAANLAGAFPDTQIILNHTGMPIDRDEEGMELWRSGMRKLADQSNVAVKISGLGLVDHSWTVAGIRPIVLETIEIFGADRCMFASNFPVDRLYSDFDTVFDAFSEITAGFSDAERSSLFSSNAECIYRI